MQLVLCPCCGKPKRVKTVTPFANGPLLWTYGSGFPKSYNYNDCSQFAGYGTALKPAWEPIILARKPRTRTYAQHAVEDGTGAIWVDGVRVPLNGDENLEQRQRGSANRGSVGDFGINKKPQDIAMYKPQGRWPANLIHDGSDEVLEVFGRAGERPSGSGDKSPTNHYDGIFKGVGKSPNPSMGGDTGSAARFFQVCPQDLACFICGSIGDQEEVLCDSVNFVNKSSSQGGNHSDSVAEVVQGVTRHGGEGRRDSLLLLASNAASNGKTTPATNGSSAQENVPILPVEQIARAVKSAESLCDSCATAIAQSLVAVLRGSAPLPLGLGSMHKHKEQILNQSLVLYAESLESTDTIPTTTSLKILFGYVRNAMQTSTPTGAMETECAPTRFRYQSKASRRERNAGLEGMEEKWRGTMSGGTHNRQDKRAGNDRTGTQMSNTHPCLKPLSLCEYLSRLILPPVEYREDAKLLVPFAGSMSEAIGALLAGWINIDAIELDEEYIEIGRRRFEWWQTMKRQTRLSDPAEILARVYPQDTADEEITETFEDLPLFEAAS